MRKFFSVSTPEAYVEGYIGPEGLYTYKATYMCYFEDFLRPDKIRDILEN